MFLRLLPPVAASYLDVLYYTFTRAAAGIALAVFTAVTVPLLVIIPLQLHRISYAPRDVPWAGQSSNTWWSKLKSTLLALKFERRNLEEGWEKYSSKGKPFVRPSLHWPSVVLPPEQAEWLAQQPETLIAASKVQDEVLSLEWLASGPSNAFIHDFTVIRRDLTRQIHACVPEILDEIRFAFDKHFCNGRDTGDGWKEVVVNDAVRRAVCSVANRVIIGLPVCRSEGYFHAVSKWWMCFGLTGLIFRSFIPRPIHRFTMPILSLPTLYWRRRVVDMFEPEVARRVHLIQDAQAKGEPSPANDNTRPNDLMQWLVEQSSRSTNPAELSPRDLANKLVLFNLFATHTITTTFTTLIVTLLTHHTSIATLSALRTEASQIIPKGSETPTLTKNMHLHDSVLRETLRLHPAFDDTMLREVVAPAGLYTPDGTYLPRGSHVALHTRLMQRSSFAGKGEDWEAFRPFRYCEMAAEGSEKLTETKVADKGPISAVQISGRYMSFGLGKHACPGRFFAVSTLKLMLAYLVLEFDMEPFPGDKQPQWMEFGGVSLLMDDTYVKMKKRDCSLDTSENAILGKIMSR